MSGKDIRITLSTLFTEGKVVELRVLRKSGGMASGYYTDFDKLTRDAEVLDNTSDIAGMYVVLNEINPVLLSRRANRIDLRLLKDDKATGDEDILRRYWFPIDIDPKRPSGISSSHEEHEEALRKAEKIRGFLTELGWPDPLVADSGNGAHLLYRIDLPNDSAVTVLIKNCLSVLSAFFSDANSDVDTSVSNAARIWKLYGTLSRKGDSTLERPHRRSGLLLIPDPLQIVDIKCLSHLSSLLSDSTGITSSPKEKISSPLADLGSWLIQYGLSYREKPFTGGRLFLFDACPFSSAHTDGAYAIQFDSGAIFAGCHHNSCGGGKQRWPELRERYEGPRPKQDYETRIREGIRKRAKARIERDGYDSSEPSLETPAGIHNPAPVSHTKSPEGTSSGETSDDSSVFRQKAIQILQSGDPLKYSLDTFALDHEGDEVVAQCLALSLASRAIANPKSKGLHVSVTGISGKGKTDAFDVMLTQVPDANRVGQRLSDKALFYAENLQPGMVITLDDTGMSDQMQEILKGVTSSFQKPFRYLTVNKDRKSQTCVIPERCVWWIAKVEGTGDDQIWNRMLTTWIDDSEQQDLKVLSRTLRSAKELPAPELVEHPEISVCQEIWGILSSPVWVVIPFSEQIRFDSASNRRNPDMLIDLIRTHAIMFQFQRERQEIGGIMCVTATLEDFSHAKVLYTRLCGESGGQTTKLTRKEAELISAIRQMDRDEITIPQLQRFTGLSYNGIYRILHGYTSRGVNYSGLLEKCPALSFTDRTVTDEKEGINVRRRAKAYLWDTLVYDKWSAADGCWISDLETSNDSDEDSGDDNGSSEDTLQHLQQPCSTCCKPTDENSEELEGNTQNNNYNDNNISNIGSRATLDCPSDIDMIHTREILCAANNNARPTNMSQNSLESPENVGITFHPLLQTSANAGKMRTHHHDPGDFLPLSSDSTAGPCDICQGPKVSYKNRTLDIRICQTCHSRLIRREAESIRTLAGTMNIAGMKRASTDYGRCKVCNLQGISWWDTETKTGLCETCYEREILLSRGRV